MLIDLVVRRSAVALIVLLAARAAFAQSGASLLPSQFEFAGSWAPLGSEDVQNDSVPVDYLGLALTDEGRTRALAYDESQKSMIERQCADGRTALREFGRVAGWARSRRRDHGLSRGHAVEDKRPEARIAAGVGTDIGRSDERLAFAVAGRVAGIVDEDL